jgi:transcriptional regulator with XRE-family HTH domain
VNCNTAIDFFLEVAVKGQFNCEAFYEALNSQRMAKRLTWKDVAEQSGISASTLTRMAQGKRPDVDGLAALLRWSGLQLDDFIDKPHQTKTEALAQITAILRTDSRLSAVGKKTLEGVLRATYEGLRKRE